MKSLKKCVTFILITLLLLGLAHPIMAEDSFGENQGNGEDTQSTENQIEEPTEEETQIPEAHIESDEPSGEEPIIEEVPVLDDPSTNTDLVPLENDTPTSGGAPLVQGPVLGDPPVDPFTQKDVSVILRGKPLVPYTVEISFEEMDGFCPIGGYYYRDSRTMDFLEPVRDGVFVIDDITPLSWSTEYPAIYIYGVLVGQKYTVKVYGKEGVETSMNYMCEAGRVKTSYAPEGTDNAVSCVARIGDEEDENNVTDPSMINRVIINAKEVIKDRTGFPFVATFKSAKGEISSACQSDFTASKDVEFVYSKEGYEMGTYYADWNEIRFRQAGVDENKEPIIEYQAENVNHYVTEMYDVFEKVGESYVEPSLLEPGKNRLYVWGATDFVDGSAKKYWIIDVEADDSKNIIGYKIYEDENKEGNLKEVDKLYIEDQKSYYGLLEIRNNTPSNKDDEFEYTIVIDPITEYTGPYYIQAKDEEFYAGEEYSFTLKHGESIVISGIEIASSYTVKQQKKGGYATTSAIEGSTRRMYPVELQTEGAKYSTGKIKMSVETNYVPSNADFGQRIPLPCHPTVGGGFKVVWNNLMQEDLKIKMHKLSPVPPVGEMYLGDATLAGAEFKAVGLNGVQLLAITNEEGIATFEGIDPTVSYIIEETKEPKGYTLPGRMIYVYRSGYDDDVLNPYLDNLYWRYNVEEITTYSDVDQAYHVAVLEGPVSVRVEVRKFYLPDESKYDGPKFEFLHFVMDNTYERKNNFVDYRESIWPRSFFEDVEGVEFLLTLDSDPDNPAYRFHATTDANGHAVFKREKPLEPGEPENMASLIFYGKYTLYEVKTPEGMVPMEPKHVTISPETRGLMDETEQVYVARVINEPTKGDLKISKTVQGSKGDKNLNFNFTITLKDGEGVVLPDEYNYEGSKQGSIKSGGTIQLKHNESVTIKDLPAGTQYEVVEEMVPNYETTVNGQKDNKSSGTIEDKKVKEVKYVNTSGVLSTPTPTPTNPPKTDPPTRYEVPNTYDPTNLNYGWILLLGLFGIYISKRLLNEDNS